MANACSVGSECSNKNDNDTIACSGGCGLQYHLACIGLGRSRHIESLFEHFDLICPRCKSASVVDVLTKVNQLKWDLTLLTGNFLQKSKDATDAENRLSNALELLDDRLLKLEEGQNQIMARFQKFQTNFEAFTPEALATKVDLENISKGFDSGLTRLEKKLTDVGKTNDLSPHLTTLTSEIRDLRASIPTMEHLGQILCRYGETLQDQPIPAAIAETSTTSATNATLTGIAKLVDQVDVISARLDDLKQAKTTVPDNETSANMPLLDEIIRVDTFTQGQISPEDITVISTSSPGRYVKLRRPSVNRNRTGNHGIRITNSIASRSGAWLMHSEPVKKIKTKPAMSKKSKPNNTKKEHQWKARSQRKTFPQRKKTSVVKESDTHLVTNGLLPTLPVLSCSPSPPPASATAAFKWIYAAGFSNTTVASTVKEMLSAALKVDDITCFPLIRRGVDPASLRSISFKLRVPASVASSALRSNVWPTGIYTREFDTSSDFIAARQGRPALGGHRFNNISATRTPSIRN